MSHNSFYIDKGKIDRSIDCNFLDFSVKLTTQGWGSDAYHENTDDWGDLISNPVMKKTREISRHKYFVFDNVQAPIDIETSEGSFCIDAKLYKIVETIKESKSLLNLKDDWDGEDAIGCNEIVLDRAINLLLKYSQNVLKYHDSVIYSPEINLGKDGSIDLEWRCKNRILIINILNMMNFKAEFYGNDFKSKTVIKGFIDSYSINRTLSFWMQNLL